MSDGRQGRVLALAGGVGGSKLAAGLYACLGDRLSVIVNTGDDETMFGLRVCPDLDTVRYTLAGLANPTTGWGLEGDSFHALAQLEALDQPAWFRLGDRDLAFHLTRTRLLAQGLRLSEVERYFDARLGLSCKLLPMCDEPVTTRVATASGEMPFQEYFVKHAHAIEVRGVRYDGITASTMTPEIKDAIAAAAAVILCPSNPSVSIGPILAVGGLRAELSRASIPKLAVSPIVGSQAVSGPAAEMLAAADIETSVVGLARFYGDLLTHIVIDQSDRQRLPELRDMGIEVLATNTIMRTAEDKRRLAGEVLDWLGV